LAGERIPFSGRVVQLAEAARVFVQSDGTEAAVAVLRRRSGTAYDPALVERFCRSADSLLGSLDEASLWELTLAAEPIPRAPMQGPELDAALRAVGEFADLKSTFTVGHSTGVAELAAAAARAAGLAEDDVRRAGWVHDLGRVGVSSRVWEKPGPLTHGEHEQVHLHPYLTERVLARPEPLAELGRLAAASRANIPTAASTCAV
jgi:HD-GYP domain-containing protein (c-di-GMP phosphodiesterase class II)